MGRAVKYMEEKQHDYFLLMTTMMLTEGQQEWENSRFIFSLQVVFFPSTTKLYSPWSSLVTSLTVRF